MFDRDMVNTIHYLYHNSQMTEKEMQDQAWCPADTEFPLVSSGILNSSGDTYQLSLPVLNFLKEVEIQLSKMPRPDFLFSFPLSRPQRKPGAKRPCFIIMPYSVLWFENVKNEIIKAAGECMFEAEVSRDVAQSGPIIDQVWQSIRASEVVIADVTGTNANVFYELGLAHALGKEVILLTQNKADVPFDIRHSRYIEYNESKLNDLSTELKAAFKAVSARYKSDGNMPWFN